MLDRPGAGSVSAPGTTHWEGIVAFRSQREQNLMKQPINGTLATVVLPKQYRERR
mgnify:CR=1 FL=1